jgi:hypothetical protein
LHAWRTAPPPPRAPHNARTHARTHVRTPRAQKHACARTHMHPCQHVPTLSLRPPRRSAIKEWNQAAAINAAARLQSMFSAAKQGGQRGGQRGGVSLGAAAAEAAAAGGTIVYAVLTLAAGPMAYDGRGPKDTGGMSPYPPPQNQGDCYTCVSFAVAAAATRCPAARAGAGASHTRPSRGPRAPPPPAGLGRIAYTGPRSVQPCAASCPPLCALATAPAYPLRSPPLRGPPQRLCLRDEVRRARHHVGGRQPSGLGRAGAEARPPWAGDPACPLRWAGSTAVC